MPDEPTGGDARGGDDEPQPREPIPGTGDQATGDERAAASQADGDAEGSSRTAAASKGKAAPHELLIHPDDVPDEEAEHRFGAPGKPFSRHSAFYVGFMGGLGALLALLIGMAVREAQGALTLIIVSIFLAVGLNPLVEALIHRGLRRPWAVLVVTLGLLGFLALFVVSLVPVLRDQIEALIDNAPQWLDDLRHNQQVQDFDEKYDIIDQIQEKLRDPDLAQTAFGGIYTVGLAVLGALFNAFLIFVLTVYFLGALPQIKRAVYSLAPASRRQRVTYLGDEVLRSVGGYVAGAFVVAL